MHSAKNIAANILKQLVAKFDEIPRDLLQLFEKRRQDPRHFKELKELRGWILKCAEYLPSVSIVLDALDECEDVSARSTIVSFLHGLLDGCVKIFLTSRLDLPKPLNNVPTIDIQAKDCDIDVFVRTKLKEAQLEAETELSSELQAEVVQSIRLNAQGM